jgi:hypothetical protein
VTVSSGVALDEASRTIINHVIMSLYDSVWMGPRGVLSANP